MRLTALDIRDVRIIEAAAIEPAPGMNLVTGANGAGKTSLLEAIHLLATGRSFAATRPTRMVRNGAGPLRVVARLRSEGGGAVHRLGIERAASGPARMRVDGGPAERLADMARMLPLVAIHPESHRLVGGPPEERRRLLDLGLFHVEPSFHSTWQRYRRALAQRNVLVRRRAADAELDPWDRELAAAGEALDRLRRDYVAALLAEVGALEPALLDSTGEVGLVYRPGWGGDGGYYEALRRTRARDREQHATTVGPHRADLVIRAGGGDVRQRVSRGQQKLLVYLIRLAQARQLGASGEPCVLLLDDLAAELDQPRRERVTATALALGLQVFVTAVDPEAVPLPPETARGLFHVERGRVSEVIQ